MRILRLVRRLKSATEIIPPVISFPTSATTSLGSIPTLTSNLVFYFCFNWLSKFSLNFLINQIQLQIIHYFMQNLFHFNKQIFVLNTINYLSNWIEVGKLIIGKGEIVR